MTNQVVDADARKEAIDPRGSFIVQAPAGSGKTELLTDRVLALLATVNKPEEIIAITFTRKAAAEMHSRVMEKLTLGLKEIAPEHDYQKVSWQLAQKVISRDKELNWGLLKNPARLKIRTIDAFCSYLIKSMPYTSTFGGLPDAASAEQADAMYQKAAMQTLALADEVPEVKSKVEVLLRHLDVNQSKSVELIVEMLGQRDQWLELVYDGVDIELLQITLEKIIQEQLQKLASSMPYGWAQTLHPMLTTAANFKIATKGADPDKSPIDYFANWDGKPFGNDINAVNDWQKLAQVLLTGSDTLRKTVDVRMGFEAKSENKDAMVEWLKSGNISDDAIENLAQAKMLPKQGYGETHKNLLDSFLYLLGIAHVKLQKCFSENNQVDFIEIAQRALSSIGSADQPTDLLLILDSKINHILVDEFQDTSYGQIKLLETLVSGWQPGDGRSLFLVGDPMQSIYRFRKAEVGLFLKTKEQGLGDVSLKPLFLKQNFRSKGYLVNSINKLFVDIFPKQDNTVLGAISYSKSYPYNSDESSKNLHFYPIYIDANNKSANEEQDLGYEIDGLATEDQTVLDIVKASLEKYQDKPNPVAILVRSRGHLNNVVQLMVNAGIPCKSIDIDSLAQQQVVQDIVQLARALSHKNDRLAWLSVLRSPLCGLNLNTLHKLFGDDSKQNKYQSIAQKLQEIVTKNKEKDISIAQLIGDDELHRLLHASVVLLDTSNDSGFIPFAAWLQKCWQRLNGDRVYASDSDQANIERTFELIEQLSPYGKLDFAQLSQAVKSLYAQSSTTGPAVEIMTIHKSKGLEFESVIIMGLNRTSRPDKSSLIDYEQIEGEFLLGPIKRVDEADSEPISKFINSRHKIRANNELDRVLYVALTRARSELHLTAVINRNSNNEPSLPGTGFLSRLYDGLLNMAVIENTQAVHSTVKAVSEYKLLRQPINQLPNLDFINQQLNKTSVSNYAISGWNWDSGRTPEQIIGTVAHDWLERMALDGAQNWSVSRIQNSDSLLCKHLSRAGVLDYEMENSLFTLKDTLIKTLESERGKWLLSVSKSYREWALLDLSGRVSIIDLAISQDDQWLIVDYKTSIPAPGEPIDIFKQRMLSTYSEQLNRYIKHVQSIDGRQAQAALYFPRIDLWLPVE